MHALFAIVTVLVVIAGFGEADAADMAISRPAYVAGYSAIAVRAPQVLIYDDEPGVYVRDYWARPWGGRHYYPFTGKRPKVGRYERLSAVRAAPKLAETFYRQWSTNALYPPPPVHLRSVPLGQ